ncbi:related to Retrotransposon protein [Ustilago hordei]|uniref:Related to Retrotransposon protein n=1 Tax=Ustilago hordei TaxID=120017 RepID=I2FQB5_USTHO|nr:related to Retrotransposon protein [Ustilago hordei]
MGTANKEVIKGWIWDTGADVHICKDESLMMDIQHTNGCIQQAQGPLIKYNTIGKVTLNVYTSTSIKHVTLSNVVLLCNGNFNLFSPRAAAKASEGDIRCNQQGRDCIMVGKDRQCKQVTWAVKSGNRLYLDVAKSQEDATAFWHMWHCHLRHASLDHIQKSLKAVGIDTHDMPKVFNCEACNAMKFICPSFGSGRNEMKAKLDVVVSDLQGPMPVLSLGGARHTHAFQLGKDACVKRCYENSSQEVAGGNKAGNRITEHVNHTIMNIIQPMLDTAKLPVPLWAKATQHVVGGVPYTLWSGQRVRMSDVKTFSTVVWVRNTKHGKSKSKLGQHGQKCFWVGVPDLSEAAHRCIDTEDYSKVYTLRDVKFNAETLSDAIIDTNLDYISQGTVNASLTWELEDELSLKNVLRNQTARMIPTREPRKSSDDDSSDLSSPSASNEQDLEENVSPVIITTQQDQHLSLARDPTDLKIKLAMVAHYLQEGSSNIRELKSSLTNEPCMRPKEQVTAACNNIRSDLNVHNATIEFVTTAGQDSLIMHNDPQTLMQAQKCTEWSSWEKAIKDKLDSLDDAGTWIITNLPENQKAITAKWVFKTKCDADGNPVKYKACLVACRFNQMHGIDYHYMYSPVVSMTCLCLVICYSLKNKLWIQQIDFVAAYLNGELTDVNIYMMLPPGFEERYRWSPQSACHLKKALYRLKQSGCKWFAKLDESLCSLGFSQLGCDVAVYKMELVIIAIYVDNIIIIGQEHEVNIIIDSIQAHFKITRGGDAEWCLGIHIQQNGESVSLAQDAYIDTVLTHFSMNQAVETNTPLDPSAANLLLTDPSHWPLTKEQVVTYQQIMGSVMYLMTSTRPNLAFPISKLASHLASPTTVHLNQAQHLLCYVLHTRSHKLVYS